jgi:hypothetical protein
MFQNRPIDGKSLLFKFKFPYILRQFSFFLIPNPPYSKSVRTNVGGRFLQLIDKHFPPTNPLHKIFNRNTIKVSSYSCMPNVKNVISRHNRKILGRSEATKPATSCNCRNQDECPLDNKCQAESIVYKAVVTSLDDGSKKEYIQNHNFFFFIVQVFNKIFN